MNIFIVVKIQKHAKIYTRITLEQIYATIFYYLHNKEQVSKYLENWLEHCHKSEQEQDKNPPAFIIKMRQLKAEREAEKQKYHEYSVSN